MKLREQLLIRFLAAAALLLGFAAAFFIRHTFELRLLREREQLATRSAALEQGLKAAAAGYALQSIPLTKDIVDRIAGQLEGRPELTPLSSMDASPPEGTILLGKTLQAQRLVRLGRDEYLLILRDDLTALYEERYALLRGYAMVYCLTLALCVPAVLLTARRIALPMERLTAVSRRLSTGEATVRAEPAGSLETRELADAFNRMADSLTGQIARQERFIANLTHEIKTPLTAIIGQADLIRSGRAREEDAMLAAQSILREGRRLNDLSARLTELILLRQDGTPLRPLAIHMVTEETVSALRPAADHRGVRLAADCDDALVDGDVTLMRSLIANLLDNALKSGARSITVRGHLRSGTYTLSICDDGRGMSAEEMNHAFEPFYRADKARSRAQGGSGLGLALCMEIARLHHAALSFESRPGEGTAAHLTLPGREADADESE